ncbi:MAG TPA: hypothetical protein VGO47_03945 [Chlamydiales bacterium]|nr:hypothetical protein [Chlamydiales bacterium]
MQDLLDVVCCGHVGIVCAPDMSSTQSLLVSTTPQCDHNNNDHNNNHDTDTVNNSNYSYNYSY